MENNQYIVLKEVTLNKLHKRTNIVQHFVKGESNPIVSSLKIVQYPEEKDYVLLIHFSQDNEELTDSYHENIEEAMEQARLEFGVRSEEWTSDNSTKKENALQH